MSPLRASAEMAWEEVRSLALEFNLALVLDGEAVSFQVHTDDTYAAYLRARERAVALTQLAEWDEGGYNPWS